MFPRTALCDLVFSVLDGQLTVTFRASTSKSHVILHKVCADFFWPSTCHLPLSTARPESVLLMQAPAGLANAGRGRIRGLYGHRRHDGRTLGRSFGWMQIAWKGLLEGILYRLKAILSGTRPTQIIRRCQADSNPDSMERWALASAPTARPYSLMGSPSCCELLSLQSACIHNAFAPATKAFT